MAQSTNLNIAPFYDDYDPTKQYYRILFRPSVPVQARELTQLQTLLQNQIEEFGQNVFEKGTIIRGCSFRFVDKYPFVKIKDNETTGAPVNVSEFANGWVVENSSNLTAKILNYKSGLESQNPNLNTLFVRYVNAGANGETQFSNNSILTVYPSDYSIQQLNIVNSGTGYNNADILTFTGGGGSGAAGFVRTNSSGAITSAVLSSAGSGYTSAPTVGVANSTGGTANGVSASITAENFFGSVTVAANVIASVGNTETYPTGLGYGFRVSDGVIFQKGFFIYVDPQEVIISPYSTTPSNLTVGFVVAESVVNNSVDTSLVDNAQGISNEGAPGAYRLKLEPTLNVVSTANLATTNNYFMLAEFQNGVPVKQKQQTQFNSIGAELAKRTSEESGDYVVKPFTIIPQQANQSHFTAWVSSGIAYVQGYRTELLGKYPVYLRKGTDVREKQNHILSTNFGSYVICDEYSGNFDFNIGGAVSLRDTASNSVTDREQTLTAPGSEIGTAKVRAVVYNSGIQGTNVCQYRLYLYDIKMNTGKNFADVRAVFSNGTYKGVCDIVLDEYGQCYLYDAQRSAMIFPIGQNAIKTLRDLNNNNDTTFVFRTKRDDVQISNTGLLTLTLTGNEYFPYSAGNLSTPEEDQFIVTLTYGGGANAAAALAGTVNVSSSSTTVLGNATAFLTDFKAGEYISANTEFRRVTAVQNNTSMEVDAAFTTTATTQTYKRYYAENKPISISQRTTRSINVASGQQSLTVNIGDNLAISTGANCSISYNVQINQAQQLTKSLQANCLVKLNLNSHSTSNTGPWSLGVPDAVSLVQVTRSTNSDYVTSAQDVTDQFELVKNDNDGYYGLSLLRRKPGVSGTVLATDYLLVKYNVFQSSATGGGKGFYSIDSYPIDDTTIPLPSDKIRTEQVPIYTSSITGTSFELRDSIDFRTQVQNTAAYTTVIGSATVNPSSTEAFSSSEKYIPGADAKFTCDLQYYLGRIDKIALTQTGQAIAINGTASLQPFEPPDQPGTMTVGTVFIPPFPSLTPVEAVTAGRQTSGTKVQFNQVERLTMRDLNVLERRVSSLEYYTSLNLLEQQTKDLMIPSEADPTINRFKNGIFVDSFKDFALANLSSTEYRASVDFTRERLVPRFEQTKIDLEIRSLTNVQQTGESLSLQYTEREIIQQPFATRTRLCAEDAWNFSGRLELIPSYDNFFETRVNPVAITPQAEETAVTTNTINLNQTIQINLPQIDGGTGVNPGTNDSLLLGRVQGRVRGTTVNLIRN
jgi:hypothetical protein